jgi:uncharacterized LabA/DUF88 family protein
MADKPRVMIFMDGSNLYHSLKKDFGHAHLDFERLARKLCGDRELIRVHYYNAPLPQEDNPDAYKAQQRFFEGMRDLPYFRVVLGRLEKRPGDVLVEKGVDIKIAVDMMRLAIQDSYDVAVLVSGDGDFASVVEAVQDFGKHVENACTPSSLSRHLRQTCDRVVKLTSEFLSDCLLADQD